MTRQTAVNRREATTDSQGGGTHPQCVTDGPRKPMSVITRIN